MNAPTKLKQTLGIFTAIMVVVSAMIGSGVFKMISQMAYELGSASLILWCWVAAGLITLFGALSNAEVAAKIAKPGGQYMYFKRMYGKRFAFLYGWSSFAVIQTATSAAVAFVFAESINEILPLPTLPSEVAQFSVLGLKPLENFGVKLVAALSILFITFINVLGVRYGGFIGNFLASTILIALAFIVFLSFYNQPITELIPAKSTVALPTKGFSIAPFFTAMLAAFWAFEGWNTVGFLGGEIKNPKRFIPIALGLGVTIVLLNYVLVNASFLRALTIDQLTQIHIQNNQYNSNLIPAIEAMKYLRGKEAAIIISILIVLSTFNTSNNSILTSPRVYYAMAKDRLWWSKFAYIHPRFQTPVVALIAHALVAVLFVFSGTFEDLTQMLVFSAFIFYAAGAWGVFVLRKKMPQIDAHAFKVPSFIPVIFVLFSIGLVVNALIENTAGSLVGIGLVLSGFPIYLFFQRKRLKARKNR